MEQYVTIPLKEFEALHAEVRRLRGWQREAEELIGHQLKEIERLQALNERLRQQGFVEAEKVERLRAAHEAHTTDKWCPICDPDMLAPHKASYD